MNTLQFTYTLPRKMETHGFSQADLISPNSRTATNKLYTSE